MIKVAIFPIPKVRINCMLFTYFDFVYTKYSSVLFNVEILTHWCNQLLFYVFSILCVQYTNIFSFNDVKLFVEKKNSAMIISFFKCVFVHSKMSSWPFVPLIDSIKSNFFKILFCLKFIVQRWEAVQNYLCFIQCQWNQLKLRYKIFKCWC